MHGGREGIGWLVSMGSFVFCVSFRWLSIRVRLGVWIGWIGSFIAMAIHHHDSLLLYSTLLSDTPSFLRIYASCDVVGGHMMSPAAEVEVNGTDLSIHSKNRHPPSAGWEDPDTGNTSSRTVQRGKPSRSRCGPKSGRKTKARQRSLQDLGALRRRTVAAGLPL